MDMSAGSGGEIIWDMEKDCDGAVRGSDLVLPEMLPLVLPGLCTGWVFLDMRLWEGDMA